MRMPGAWWHCRQCYTYNTRAQVQCHHCGNVHDSLMYASASNKTNPLHSYDAVKGKGKGWRLGKGKGKGKGTGAPPGSQPSQPQLWVWDGQSNSYAEYSPPRVRNGHEPNGTTGAQQLEPTLGRWRASRRERQRNRPEQDSASEVSETESLRKDLAALQSAETAIRGATSDRATALRASLGLEKQSLMHAITNAQPLGEQVKTLEAALFRKKEALTEAEAVVKDALASMHKTKADICQINQKLSAVKTKLAEEQMQAAQRAAQEASQSAMDHTLPASYAGAPATPSQAGAELHASAHAASGSPLTGSHLHFLQGLAAFLPPHQGQAFVNGIQAMMPMLQAAGVTPVAMQQAPQTQAYASEAPVTSAPQTCAAADPYGNAVPMTPSTHINAGGPPPKNSRETRQHCPADTDVPIGEGTSSGRSRALARHDSDESQGSRALSRRRMRAKTVDPFLGRLGSDLPSD